MKKILVLHGVNLNMFGKRDPAQYGTVTLDEINRKLEALGKELGCTVEAFQTNDEGAICGKIHDAHGRGSMPFSSMPAPGRITATPCGTPWPF